MRRTVQRTIFSKCRSSGFRCEEISADSVKRKQLWWSNSIICKTGALFMSRFMGSRSHPHRVLSVCMCVCVSRCLWVCVIEANSLQLRVITIGLYQFLSRSPSCQILAVFAVVVYGPFWFRDSWALLLPGLRSPDLWLPIASLRYPPLPYGKLSFCLRKAPLLPTESSASALRKAPFLPTESSASAYGKLRLCPTESSVSAYGKLRLCLRRAPL